VLGRMEVQVRTAPERTGKMGMDASNIYVGVNERHSYHW